MTQILCDICEIEGTERKPASYDAKSLLGPWAYMCNDHYMLWADRTPGFSTKLKTEVVDK